ncbi:hypothetical protein [Portibacter marinus]|uniref:hypothetical protein n=1 Tax=Portibacter marinus TaxID=2898660 RepID=UPI001F2E9761|nr:hypothetical protein [Portibacter marinus]
MKEQLDILEPMIGKYLSYIFFQRIQQKPFPKLKSELLAYQKFCLAFNGEKSTTQYLYTIELLYIEFQNHDNPFKLRIKEENIFEPKIRSGIKLEQDYNSTVEIGFKIGSIYFYEDDQRWNVKPGFSQVDEILSKGLIGSTIIINDETGLRNIWISTYEIPGEQAENETSVKFQIGNIFSENNLITNDKMKLLGKIGKAPEYK